MTKIENFTTVFARVRVPGMMFFRTPNQGQPQAVNTKYSRAELREMMGVIIISKAGRIDGNMKATFPSPGFIYR